MAQLDVSRAKGERPFKWPSGLTQPRSHAARSDVREYKTTPRYYADAGPLTAILLFNVLLSYSS